MPDKKLTDAEITVKALKQILELMLCEGDLQRTSTISHAIDLINRQKAEIERLQQYHDDMEDAIYSFREDHAKVKFFKNEIKAEAYKEFADKLKLHAYHECDITGYRYLVVQIEEIDNLLKELVGEDK